jgi:hypothetical protein
VSGEELRALMSRVPSSVARLRQALGATLVWKVRAAGTAVACLRVSEVGPAILISGHLQDCG